MVNSLNELLDSEKESRYLLNEILGKNLDNSNTKVIFKLVIPMLVTKLEAFTEKVTSQYFRDLQDIIGITTEHLPNIMRLEIVKQTHAELKNDLENGKLQLENENKFGNLLILKNPKISLKDIVLDFRITLNGTGPKEFIKLFRKIGIDDIFERISEIEKKNRNATEIFTVSIASNIDIRGNIDRLLNYRHKIIHEDVLLVVSIDDINTFIEVLNKYSSYVNEILNEQINQISTEVEEYYNKTVDEDEKDIKISILEKELLEKNDIKN